jgi:hypothetical protein
MVVKRESIAGPTEDLKSTEEDWGSLNDRLKGKQIRKLIFPQKWFNQKTNGTIKNCSSRAFH